MMDHENIAHGTPAAYREYIYEMLARAQIHADLGARYAAAGSDAGLQYAIRCLVIYARAAVIAQKDLVEMMESRRAK
jgi:hypothetical protein